MDSQWKNIGIYKNLLSFVFGFMEGWLDPPLPLLCVVLNRQSYQIVIAPTDVFSLMLVDEFAHGKHGDITLDEFHYSVSHCKNVVHDIKFLMFSDVFTFG